MSDLRRKIELWMCAQISAQIPGLLCVPSDADAELQPPYCVCVAEKGDQDGGDATILTELLVIYATSIFDQTAPQRSSDFKNILTATRNPVIGSFHELGMIISGADIMGDLSVEDKETNSRGQVVKLNVGATDMDVVIGAMVNDPLLDSISARRRGYSTFLGNGSLRSFPIPHNLGTDNFGYFTLRDTDPNGRVYAAERDFIVTIVDNNNLTIDLLDLRVPANPDNVAGASTPGYNGMIFTVLAL